MHRVFISYHHANDQDLKDELVAMANKMGIFADWSVGMDEISDDLPDETIRKIIRDEYLRDSTVTILLVGEETKNRKHIDWELYSSMYDGKINKKSGIIVITLPSVESTYYTASHSGEKENVFPVTTWMTITDRAEFERRYPHMPARIIDNLLKSEAKISVIPWRMVTPEKLKYMIEKAFEDRENCKYDLSRPMRRNNS